MPSLIQERMLEVLSASLWGQEGNFHCADVWSDLLDEMDKQAVSCIPGRIIDSLDLDSRQYTDYQTRIGDNLRSFYGILAAQSKVLDLFKTNDIPVVVLKGAAAAMYYPKADLRSMGDIDLIVLPEDFDRAHALLSRAGYREESNEKYQRHAKFFDTLDHEIELHRFFSSSQNATANQVVDSIVFDGIRGREWADVFGFKIPVLPPMANGIVLLEHINHHLSSGLGLRQIIDWMMYVKTHLDDDLWNSSFRTAAESIGLGRLAEVVTAMCRKYLGLRIDSNWYSSVENELCDELMAYILSRGNFGRAESFSSKASTNVLVQFRNPVSAFRYLQAGGRYHWKAIKQHPWLGHIAWIYQICHLVKMGLKHGIGLKTVSGSSSKAGRTANLIAKLGVTRI